MKGYTRVKVVSPADVRVFEAATLIVSTFPDSDTEGHALRCHEVARAVHRLLTNHMCVSYRGEVCDGVMNAVDHSWLLLKPDPFQRATAILDTYTMARLPPVQLVAPWMGQEGAYIDRGHRSDIRMGDVEYLVQVFLARLGASPTLCAAFYGC